MLKGVKGNLLNDPTMMVRCDFMERSLDGRRMTGDAECNAETNLPIVYRSSAS